MPKKIPLSKCRRCVHYGRSGHQMCPLQDLEPCMFKEINPRRKMLQTALIATAVAVIALIGMLFII